MLPRDVYHQPNASDPVLDEQTVLALVRRHVPGATRVTGVDESGGEARAYRVDDDLILKTQRPHRLRPRTSLEKEVFFLTQLASHPAISVPRVLGYGREGDIEYICMSRIPGVPARSTSLKGAKRTEVLRQVGRTLRLIHGLPQPPFFSNQLFPGVRSFDEFVQRLEAGFAQAVSTIMATPSLWPFEVSPQQLASNAMAALPESATLVALHSNPGPEHIFVDPDTLTFTGLIDFGDAYIGHPAFDWRWSHPADRNAILDGYQAEAPVDKEFLTTWRSVLTLTDMTIVATRPDGRAQALGNLASLMQEKQSAS